MTAPTVGRVVHYVSYGTPIRPDGSQAYTAQCRAAVVTEVYERFFDPETPGDDIETDRVGLCVLNPTGQFFSAGIAHDEAGKRGGTWHWPERETG